MSKKLLVVDPICPSAYSPIALDNGGLGGTEATVVRIAEALGLSFGDGVVVAQHCRGHTTQKEALYTPIQYRMLKEKYAAIVVLRHPHVAMNFKATHKDTPVYLWCHDTFTPAFVNTMPELQEAGVEVICVSHYHRNQLLAIARANTEIRKLPVLHVIYNPITDALRPEGTQVDPNKLVFFSSPHKGLTEVIDAFHAARRFNPAFTLYLANPGYMPSSTAGGGVTGIKNLGVLNHVAVMEHVRSALCVFYPNYSFPETFGLIFAEANAVGTPVLAHNFGAAREVLNGDFQVGDCRNRVETVDKLMSWHKERPRVEAREEFRLGSVIRAWERLLGVV